MLQNLPCWSCVCPKPKYARKTKNISEKNLVVHLLTVFEVEVGVKLPGRPRRVASGTDERLPMVRDVFGTVLDRRGSEGRFRDSDCVTFPERDVPREKVEIRVTPRRARPPVIESRERERERERNK